MRLFLFVNITLYMLLAAFHVARLAAGWSITVGGAQISATASWPLLVVALVMFTWAIRLYQANRPAPDLLG